MTTLTHALGLYVTFCVFCFIASMIVSNIGRPNIRRKKEAIGLRIATRKKRITRMRLKKPRQNSREVKIQDIPDHITWL